MACTTGETGQKRPSAFLCATIESNVADSVWPGNSGDVTQTLRQGIHMQKDDKLIR
jgi:hypothetical protein